MPYFSYFMMFVCIALFLFLGDLPFMLFAILFAIFGVAYDIADELEGRD